MKQQLSIASVGLAVAKIIVLTVFCLSSILPTAAAAQQRDPSPMTRAQFDALFARTDNAGRWGADDSRGTLNLVSADVRRAAAAEVRDGNSVSLARQVVPGDVPGAFEPGVMNFIIASDSILGPSDGSVIWTVERIGFVFHGWSVTHIDALSHLSYRGRTYNGPAERDTTGMPLRNRVDAMRDGIVTRGVLVDLPRLRGVPFLRPGSVITTEDLEAWERRAGVRLRQGDVLLLRSGRWSPEAVASGVAGSAGLHPSAAAWLHERGVAAVGDEGGTDLKPSVVSGITSPFHVLALVAMGMPLLENLDLERLATEATARSRWSFLFIAAPLDLRGGTGSPVNPLALF